MPQTLRNRRPKQIVRQIRRIHLSDLPQLPFEELESLNLFLLDIDLDIYPDTAIMLCLGYEDTVFPPGDILGEGFCLTRYSDPALRQQLDQGILPCMCSAETERATPAWQLKTFGERMS